MSQLQTGKLEKLVRVWESTGLHRAWEVPVQCEAIEKASEIFKDVERPDEWAPTVDINEETGQAHSKPDPDPSNENMALDDVLGGRGCNGRQPEREQIDAQLKCAELARRMEANEQQQASKPSSLHQALHSIFRLGHRQGCFCLTEM